MQVQQDWASPCQPLFFPQVTVDSCLAVSAIEAGSGQILASAALPLHSLELYRQHRLRLPSQSDRGDFWFCFQLLVK